MLLMELLLLLRRRRGVLERAADHCSCAAGACVVVRHMRCAVWFLLCVAPTVPVRTVLALSSCSYSAPLYRTVP